MGKIFKLRTTIFIFSFFMTAVMGALLFAAPHVSGTAEADKGKMLSEQDVEEVSYKTTLVQQKEIPDLVIPGKVLSHESATIYPRRPGIVKDIYLDIGDPVREGQVIATLLPDGVEGHSGALIAEKGAMVEKARANYVNAQNIAQVAIENAERQLMNQEGVSTKVSNAQKNVEVAQSNLKLSQEALEKKLVDVENSLEDAKNDYEQEREQILSVVSTSITPIDSMLATFTKTTSTQELQDSTLPYYFSAQSMPARRDFILQYNSYLTTKKNITSGDYTDAELNRHVEITLNLTYAAEEVLRNTLGNDKYTFAEINTHLSAILDNRNAMLAQQEAYEDALNAYDNTVSSTDTTLTQLQNQVEKDKSMLEYTVDVLNNISTTAQEDVKTIRAREQQNIDRAKTELGVARAALNVEYSKSGHVEIRSPFTGIIAKRHILVGDVVNTSNPVFELSGVATSLSKKSRQEIKFGIDEESYSLIGLGDEVEFFIPDAETKKYNATITRVSPQVDPVTHNILVQANINSEASFPNHMNVRVVIPESQEVVYQVPSMLIKEDSGLNYVWILKDDTHQKFAIDVISEDGEFADVKGDLTEDTLLITSSPDSFLNDDMQ